MNINLAIIADEFPDENIEGCLNLNTELDISDYALYKSGLEFADETVYIIDGEKFTTNLLESPIQNWIICNSPRWKIPETIHTQILILKNTDITNELETRLTQIIYRYTKLENGLLSSAFMRLGSPQNAFDFDISLELLQNPMLLFNPSDICVGVAGNLPPSCPSSFWRSCEKSLKKQSDANPMKFPLTHDLKEEPHVIAQRGKYSFLLANILVDGSIYSRVVFCDSNRPFSLGFMSLVKYFRNYLQQLSKFGIRNSSIGNREEDFFIEIIKNKRIPQAWFNMHKEIFDWEEHKHLKVAIVFSNNTDNLSNSNNSYNIDHVVSQCHHAFPECRTFVFENRAVILFASNNAIPETKIETQAKKLSLSQNHYLYVSQEFYDIRRLRFFYKQCNLMYSNMDKSFVENQDNKVHFYDGHDFIIEMISHYRIDSDWYWMIHPKIALLHDYDVEQHTQYVECVMVFIESGFNIKQAANSLFVHYNTLDNKLRKIEKLANLNMKDPDSFEDDLFQIFFSCKLLAESSSLDNNDSLETQLHTHIHEENSSGKDE